MVDDCIAKGKSVQEGGAVYNFTGPQGFGIANVADGLYAVKELVFEQRRLTLAQFRDALDANYGRTTLTDAQIAEATTKVVKQLQAAGENVTPETIARVAQMVSAPKVTPEQKKFYDQLLSWIEELPQLGNDDRKVDMFARDAAYTYTRPMEKFDNPRGGKFQAGLYPVSANVPLGAQTGATPDGRLAFTPVADGVSPSAGKDTHGPTAAANSVSRLDHGIASNGTLYNMKFHPSALAGNTGLRSFVSLIRAYFDQKGSHVQFNVVSRETLLDAQKHPENYKTLVVRVAGYSALFTTLSRSLQDDIIRRTEQAGI
jgi:formate C-acetyltransferase